MEAQTITVWRQSEKYNVPNIVFLNKMDKRGADFYASLNSVKDKLSTQTYTAQLPIRTAASDFIGVVDVLRMEKILWDTADPDGRRYDRVELCKVIDGSLYEEAFEARNNLLGQLADVDDDVAELVLSETDLNNVRANVIAKALRKATLLQKGVPIFCGSALKNKGVQPLLDAVVLYLPSPVDREYDFVKFYGDSLCALAFKIVHDKQKGCLTFARIYSGSLHGKSSVYNVNRDLTEKTGPLYLVQADHHKEVDEATAGNIIAVSGLKEVY